MSMDPSSLGVNLCSMLCDDVILSIFVHLEFPSRILASCVSRRWRALALSPHLWKSMSIAPYHSMPECAVHLLEFYHVHPAVSRALVDADISLVGPLAASPTAPLLQGIAHLLCGDATGSLRRIRSHHLVTHRTAHLVLRVGLLNSIGSAEHFAQLRHLDVRGCDPAYVKALCANIRAPLESFKVGFTRERHFPTEYRELLPLSSSDLLDADHSAKFLHRLHTLWAPGCERVRIIEHVLSSMMGKATIKDINVTHTRTTDRVCAAIAGRLGGSLEALNLRANPISSSGALSLAEGCPNLCKINLGCTQVTLSSVMAIVRRCSSLEYLDLCYCTHIMHKSREDLENFIEQIVRYLPSLRMIGLGGFRSVSDEYFASALSRLPLLDHIGIGGMVHLGSRSIQAIGSSNTALTNLNAHKMGSEFRYKEFCDHILTNCPNLLTIDVSQCVAFTAEEIESVQNRYNHDTEDW